MEICRGDDEGGNRQQGTGNREQEVLLPRFLLQTLGYLGAVQKLFVQNAQDEFVSARRRREACRGTLTDDNAAMADSDKHNV